MDTSWEQIYQERGKVQSKIKQIVKDLLEFKKIGNVLDLGCGTGRHSFFLVENGFDVYGGDVSETAVNIIREKGSVKVSVFSKEEIPFEDNFFDIIIITNVLSHSLIKDIKDSIKEIDRVLKKDGLVVFCDLSADDANFGKGKKVEENTYSEIPELLDKCVHHFFTKQEIEELFNNYKTLKYYETKNRFVLHNFILKK